MDLIYALKKISSPSVANGIETFNVRPRNQGFVSSEIRALFPELGPLVGYAVTALIRAEPAPVPGHRASTFAWWDYVLSIPAPRVVVVHDLDEVRALGFQFAAAHVSVSHAYVHMVDFGLPVKVGGLWVKPGDLIHADHHGALAIPSEIADRLPEAVASIEADERKIISCCQSPTFSAEGLKELFKQVRPGTY